MRLPCCCPCLLLALIALVTPTGAMAAESATASITVTAEFASRTTLKVSSQVLQFDVADATQSGVVTVVFAAAARTRAGGEVVLTVEPLRGLEEDGGAADENTSITFSGSGNGTLGGMLRRVGAVVAGRWNGSGLRTGRLTFTLRAPVSGGYSVPVRFVLTTP